MILGCDMTIRYACGHSVLVFKGARGWSWQCPLCGIPWQKAEAFFPVPEPNREARRHPA